MKPQPPTPIWTALTQYCLPARIFNNRWLAPILFLPLLTSYVAYGALTSARQLSVTANAWDIVVEVLNGRLWVHHGLINLLIYLVSSITLFGESGQLVLLRTGSRWLWFQLQSICAITAVVAYIALLVVIIVGVAALLAPWTLTWSSAAAAILNQHGLPADALLRLSPLSTAVLMLILLGCAWIGISIAVATVTLATQNATYGFIAGLALNYSALIITLADIRLPFLDELWFHQRMFLWGNKPTTDSLTDMVIQALLYWLVWSTAGLTALWVVCRNLDIVAKNSG
jgi:hypothetical protein